VAKSNGHERNTLTPSQYRELQHSFAARIMHDPKMSPGFLKVGVAYLLHINSETGAAWPKIKTITDLTGVCGKTVSRARKYFALKGHVTEERRPGKSLICYPQPKDDPGQQDVLTHGADPGQQDVPTGVDHKMSGGSGQQDVHRLLNTQRLTLNRGLRSHRSPDGSLTKPEERKEVGRRSEDSSSSGAKHFVEAETPQWEAWSKLKRWPQTDSRIDGRIKRGWWFPSEWPPDSQLSAQIESGAIG
jgi:hypothetical protein